MIRATSVLAAIMLLSACVPYTGVADQAVYEEGVRVAPNPTRLSAPTNRAVDGMLAQAPLLLATHSPAVVGSIADIRDVNQATPLGNIIAELTRSRLVQRGLPVSEMRLRTEVALEPGIGEMTLSRQRRQVYPPPVAAEIVTGTYAVASDAVYVSLKIVEADNARILAAMDFVLPRTPDVDTLLTSDIAAR